MLTHPRRFVAACASVLLVLGLVGWTSSPSQADETLWTAKGVLASPGWTYHISPVTVRFYRATDDIESPWTLVHTTSTKPQWGDSANRFEYQAALPDGTYRVTFNELDDGTAARGAWTSQSDDFTIAGANKSLGQTYLDFRGGTIKGQVTDQCGASVSYAKFQVFDAGLSSPVPSYTQAGDSYGRFEIRGLAGPTKVLVIPNDQALNIYSPTWLGNGSSFDTAQAITVEPGEVSTGNDMVIRRQLDLSPGNVQGFWGRVTAPWTAGSDAEGIGGVPVRAYRATGETDNPWVLEKTVYTEPRITSNASIQPGSYKLMVPPGEYRLTYNTTLDGAVDSAAWLPRQFPSNTTRRCLASGALHTSTDVGLAYAGGPITGRLTTPRGLPIQGASVEAYDASNVSGGALPAPVSVTTTNENGEYTSHGVSGPTKLRFSKADLAAPEWFNDGTSFETATPLTVPLDQTSAGNDAVLADAQLRMVRGPSIRGTAKYGSSVAVGNSAWSPGYPLTRTYRWMRKSGTTLTPIYGATSWRYTVQAADLGKRLVLRETVTPNGNYPGVAAVTKYSGASAYIKRQSWVNVTANRSSGRVKLTVKVTVKGVAHPSGWIRLRAQHYTSSGRPDGAEKAKTVKFTDGRATWSFSGPKGYWGYDARYNGSANVASSSDAGYGFYGF